MLKLLFEDAVARAVAYGVRPRIMTRGRYFELFRSRGYHVLPVHFYQPVPDTRALPAGAFEAESELPGVDMNDAGQRALLERIVSLRDEYDALEGAGGYRFDNPNFSAVDAEVLYAMVRLGRPRRVLEVGSGYSTLVACAAAAAVEREGGRRPEIVCVEPYPPACLEPRPAQIDRFIAARAQDVPMEEFLRLGGGADGRAGGEGGGGGGGDILFIDSTHVLAIGSDVQRLFLEVLPRLAPGVVVHIHDVFFPRDYPREWVMERRLFWTEQYLLQAFLAFNSAWEVLWCGSWMRLRHAGLLERAFASFRARSGAARPSSFWMRRVR